MTKRKVASNISTSPKLSKTIDCSAPSEDTLISLKTDRSKQQLIDPNICMKDPSTSSDAVMSNSAVLCRKLDYNFFNQDCQILAKALLGKVLVRKVDGKRLSGIIVETESYLGGEDKASHTYNNKRTPRNEPMYMIPGTAYVYPIYGMYYCFNISSKEDGSCVLIRALEPLEGKDQIILNRNAKSKSKTLLKELQLCNGPSKLCQSLCISKELCNKVNMPISNEFWVEEESSSNTKVIVQCKRIGIESAGEIWANKPLRFYILNNKYVSVRNKNAEFNS